MYRISMMVLACVCFASALAFDADRSSPLGDGEQALLVGGEEPCYAHEEPKNCEEEWTNTLTKCSETPCGWTKYQFDDGSSLHRPNCPTNTFEIQPKDAQQWAPTPTTPLPEGVDIGYDDFVEDIDPNYCYSCTACASTPPTMSGPTGCVEVNGNQYCAVGTSPATELGPYWSCRLAGEQCFRQEE